MLLSKDPHSNPSLRGMSDEEPSWLVVWGPPCEAAGFFPNMFYPMACKLYGIDSIGDYLHADDSALHAWQSVHASGM